MNPILKKQYLQYQYEKIQNSEYQLVYSESQNGISYVAKQVYIFHKDNHHLENLKIFQIKNQVHFISLVDTGMLKSLRNTQETKDFLLNIYADFFKENKDNRSEILKSFSSMINDLLEKNYQSLFPKIFNSKQELISNLATLPTKSFRFLGDMKDFHQFLIDFGLTTHEIKNVFFSYYQQRQSIFKEPHSATQAKNFLIDLYQNDMVGLERYFIFMPFLKNHFSPVENPQEIFQYKEYSKMTCEINLKTILKKFSFDNFHLTAYEKMVTSFAKTYAEHMQAENIKIHLTSEKKDEILVMIYHHHPQLTEETFENKLIGFLQQAKHNLRVEPEHIKAWLIKTQLEDSLPVENENRVKRKI